MEYLKDKEFLQFHSDTLETIRKLRGFSSRSEMNEAVDILDSWVKKQDYFLEHNFDREYLERVIISSKGSMELSKKQIDKLCTLRTLPSFKMYFEDIDPKENLAEIFDPSLCGISIVSKLTKDHDRVIVFRQNTKKYTFQIQQKLFKLLFLVAHYLKYNDYSNSYIMVIDLTDSDVSSIVTSFSIPELIKVSGGLLQNGGYRIKEFHIINSSSLLEALLKIAKLGLPTKLHNRLQAHRNYEAIHAYVPVQILPKDYGGNEPLIDKQFVKLMDMLSSEEYRKHRREMNSMGTDESKRRTDVFNEQYMGMPGTFRTLSVD